jgi:dienelactone hydrolase
MNTIDELKQEAQNFIRQVAEGDFSGACRRFDPKLLQVFSEDRLKETWSQITGQAGPFQKFLGTQAVERQGYIVVAVSCQFEKLPADLRVTFNQSGQVAGLNYQPPAAAVPYNPPAYVKPAAFQEVEVTVGSGEWALPGTLSLPVDRSRKLAAVVLVHGSGPQDRDETLGPNKPFRDLAWGLASQGIAVLRYEKRTKAHAGKFTPEQVARITSKEEVIDDALSAVELLRHRPEIDPHQVYVLGHSLGATLAPRIGQQDPAIAGLIIMAGMTRSLEDVILDQFTYLYSLSGGMDDSQKAELEQLKIKVARVKDPNFSDQVPATDLPLGIYPAYWLDLRGYFPAEVAKGLSMRVFVLQGGRDYQVTPAGDFSGWKSALAGKSSAMLKLYPALYHLFIAGEGHSTPQEYTVEGHVSEEVIQDIARWIHQP